MSLEHLQFTFWPPMILFALIAAAIGWYSIGRGMHTIYRGLLALVMLGVGFAWGEGAGIHVGPAAAKWLLVGVILWLPLGFVYHFGERAKESDTEKSAASNKAELDPDPEVVRRVDKL